VIKNTDAAVELIVLLKELIYFYQNDGKRKTNLIEIFTNIMNIFPNI